MRRAMLWAGLLIAGCQRDSASDPRAPSDPATASAIRSAPDPSAAEPVRRLYFGLDCHSWPCATATPIPVEPNLMFLCTSTPPAEFEKKSRAEHGPHFAAFMVVRINPGRSAPFLAKKSPLPAGTTVVKEKHLDDSAGSDPIAVAMMIKREKGYDPENGDWEYAYQTLRGERAGEVERGRITSCIDCHQRAKGRDYLFRNYL